MRRDIDLFPKSNVEQAGHMVQETGAPLAELILKRIAEEPR